MTARLRNFLRDWLLFLGLKECLVERATLCVKSEVILMSRLVVVVCMLVNHTMKRVYCESLKLCICMKWEKVSLTQCKKKCPTVYATSRTTPQVINNSIMYSNCSPTTKKCAEVVRRDHTMVSMLVCQLTFSD